MVNQILYTTKALLVSGSAPVGTLIFDPATGVFVGIVNGNGTLTGSAGTTTNDAAPAGNIGEMLTSTVASGSAVALTTATPANMTSLSLTAGDWEVTGSADFVLTAATSTSFQLGLSTTSATLPTQAGGSGIGTDPLTKLPIVTTLLSDTVTIHTGSVRITLTATTTIYAVAQQAFSAGSSSVYGTLKARRVR